MLDSLSAFLTWHQQYQALFKRRISRVANLMLMRKIYGYCSFALDSAQVKCDISLGA